MATGNRTPPTVEEFERFRERLSNWGRWGEDDMLGTLNHITPELRRSAATLVQDGRAVSLALPIDASPRAGFPSGFDTALR